MAEAIRAILLTLLFAYIMTIQTNLDTDKTATRQLKNAVELAAHDASLAIDSSQLANGKLVFNQVKAADNLKKSLQFHLKLDSNYNPLTNSLYQDKVTIEHIEFIDDSMATFPFTYYNSDYDIVDTLDGPSIVVVISTPSPRYFAGDKIPIRQAAVYEYKF
ncbi:peptidase M23 [Rossellomorea sp. NPDC071047]|uniref:peptidase M23 n=1 Tax=Rossellomorea sp. NPDC071047 TaxID=3390675 RepID=UPI003CFD06E7